MFHSVSLQLQQDIRFLWHLDPDLQQHASRLACPRGRRTQGATFHINDQIDDLGVPFTPMVQQFRAGSYETCNLTTYRSR